MANNKVKARIIEYYGTQADFAVKLGIREPTVSRVVNGRIRLSDKDKKFWAKKLESPVDELFPTGSECQSGV